MEFLSLDVLTVAPALATLLPMSSSLRVVYVVLEPEFVNCGCCDPQRSEVLGVFTDNLRALELAGLDPARWIAKTLLTEGPPPQ